MYLQSEDQLICAMFQTITAFEMKLKLWQTQVITDNNFVNFDMFAKHSPVNSPAFNFDKGNNRLQDFQKSPQFFFLHIHNSFIS